MIGGYYIVCVCLFNDCSSQCSDVGWCLFDDSMVIMVDESQVVMCYVYVFFYCWWNFFVERFFRVGYFEYYLDLGFVVEVVVSQGLGFGQVFEVVFMWIVFECFVFFVDWLVFIYSNMEEVDQQVFG